MACCGTGPGFATPRDAFRYATREKLVYIPCIVPSKDRPDYLATVDIDPESPTFCKAWSNFTLESTTKDKLVQKFMNFPNSNYPPLCNECKIQSIYHFDETISYCRIYFDDLLFNDETFCLLQVNRWYLED